MKTKIIYISGNEVFEMAQIRAAFEEVRATLGLDNDTILFGVPVDSDNALASTESEKNITADEPAIIPQVIETETITETVICEPEIIDETPEQIADINEEPIKEEQIEITVEEPVAEVETEPVIEETPEATNEEVAIPILSVLSTNDDNEPEQTDEPESTSEQAIEVEEPEAETAEDILPVSVSDVINSEIPQQEPKKKLELEDILDATTPLEEYVVNDTMDSENVLEQAFDDEPVVEAEIDAPEDFTDTDATLEQLANEFAQTQDKIPEPKKSTTTGKIGKLKNILPFKKAKRDDSGLMGDLFGWAGIAANDEDFSIPGFFTSAGGQK